MARKPALNPEALAALGAEKLARLVYHEAGRNAAFKKLVAAALAGTKGPKAVVALIDRRLSALERARGFIDWDKAKSFAADLGATIQTIIGELGEAAPALAADRLLRFLATHTTVLDRVDDSNGRIQDVYETAVGALEPIVAAMPEDERRLLPGQITSRLAKDTQGYWILAAQAIAKLIPADALRAWDDDLNGEQSTLARTRRSGRDCQHDSRLAGLIAVRQAIADARGHLDGFIALEEAKPDYSRNPMDIAERLLTAGRPEEALTWIRRPQGRRMAYMTSADVADGTPVQDFGAKPRILLEARILDAVGDRDGAQSVRWAAFEATLDADLLRAYVQRLDDFAEFEVLDRAVAHVAGSPQRYRALNFFLAWPRLDLAASLVIAHHTIWNGRHYGALLPVAEALEADHPIAATLLYRALLDEILASARSTAYGHGARYLARLDDLADRFDVPPNGALESPAAYRARLLTSHGRKAGFWAQVRASA